MLLKRRSMNEYLFLTFRQKLNSFKPLNNAPDQNIYKFI